MPACQGPNLRDVALEEAVRPLVWFASKLQVLVGRREGTGEAVVRPVGAIAVRHDPAAHRRPARALLGVCRAKHMHARGERYSLVGQPLDSNCAMW